jgi:hypothetical protein
MNSGSLGNRSARLPKQVSNVNRPTARRSNRNPQAETATPSQCRNGTCELVWKPVPATEKVTDNLGS